MKIKLKVGSYNGADGKVYNPGDIMEGSLADLPPLFRPMWEEIEEKPVSKKRPKRAKEKPVEASTAPPKKRATRRKRKSI